MATAHAFNDPLARLDAVATAEAIRRGDVSAEEVVAAAVARAKAVNPQINAVACPDYERALALAKAPRTVQARVFAGVPTFIKDMTDVAGLPTRYGSAAFASAEPAAKTFAIAQQMFDMGMVCLGKSTLPEFGFTTSTEFPVGDPTRNPWNLDRSAGGSSGGAGALVASGVVPIAHGQDGAGSIRLPASCNGLVGLKSSRGRLVSDPHDRLMPLRIVVDGVLTRSVRDTAAYFAEAERVYRNPKLAPVGHVETPIERPLRVGALVDPLGDAVVDGPTRAVFEQTTALLESLGHSVRPVPQPVDERFAEDFVHYWSMLAFATRSAGKVLFDRSFDKTRLTALSDGLSARFRSHIANTPGAILRLRKAAAAYQAQFAELDVILSPTIACLPPEVGHLRPDQPFDVVFPRVAQWFGFTALANATGAPAISLPLGHDQDANLPIGMLFNAPLGHDDLLLRLGLQLEAAQPFRTLADFAPRD